MAKRLAVAQAVSITARCGRCSIGDYVLRGENNPGMRSLGKLKIELKKAFDYLEEQSPTTQNLL